MQASAVAKHIDHALACARAVVPLVSEIEGAEAKLAALQTELGRLGSQTRYLQDVFAKEKLAFAEERRKWMAESDRDYGDRQLVEEELLAKLAAARDELRALQNSIGAVRRRLEKLAALFRKLEEMRAFPSAGAPGMASALAEIAELTAR
jgi:chromosome segregation ATPase